MYKHEKLPHKKQKAMMISAEKGASSWLTTSPIVEHGLDYTREPLEVPSVFTMVGVHHSWHHIASVAKDPQWNMHLAAAEEDSRQKDIMKPVI